MKKFILLLGKVVSSFALAVTLLNVNSACIFLTHQDEIPESANKLKKI